MKNTTTQNMENSLLQGQFARPTKVGDSVVSTCDQGKLIRKGDTGKVVKFTQQYTPGCGLSKCWYLLVETAEGHLTESRMATTGWATI